MQTVTDTKFKKELFSILNQVGNTHIPITITRRHNQPVVLLSLEGYQAIENIFEAIDDPYKLYMDAKKSLK